MTGDDSVPEMSVDLKTLDRAEVGLSFRRRLSHREEDKEVDTPCAAIPASKLDHEDQILEESRGVNEFYRKVDSTDLRDVREDGDGIQIPGLDENPENSRDDEFDFAFLEYDDAHQITKIEAYQMVGILAETSDFLPVPVHPKVYGKIERDTLQDPWYQRYRDGVELFLRACHEHESNAPIMGAIPPLELEFLEDLLNLYETYDVFSFYFDYDWCLPNRPNQIARTGYLARRISNQRHHDDVLIYAINARRGKFDGDIGYAPAADFWTALMGVDIVGCNHSSPPWPEEVFEGLEENNHFHLYKSEITGYIRTDPDNLEEHLPEETNIDHAELVDSATASSTARGRYQKLLNSEQMARDLNDLREAMEESETASFLDDRRVVDELLEAGDAVRDRFEEGLQRELGEYT